MKPMARPLIGCQPSITAQPQPATATTSAEVKDTTSVGMPTRQEAHEDVAEAADHRAQQGEPGPGVEVAGMRLDHQQHAQRSRR